MTGPEHTEADTTALILRHARRPIRQLAQLLAYRGTFGRPCYLKRNTRHAALIVPHLRNGATGPYAYLRTFDRATVHEALVLGFITLGADLVDVPEFTADHWSADRAHKGRTIALTGDTTA